MLAKSCKMIPVMVMGTLIGGKLYTSLEYGCAILIAAGISLFAKQSSSKVMAKLAAPNAPLGYSLCCLNLVFDGYTNAMQVSSAQRGTLPVSLIMLPDNSDNSSTTALHDVHRLVAPLSALRALVLGCSPGNTGYH